MAYSCLQQEIYLRACVFLYWMCWIWLLLFCVFISFYYQHTHIYSHRIVYFNSRARFPLTPLYWVLCCTKAEQLAYIVIFKQKSFSLACVCFRLDVMVVSHDFLCASVSHASLSHTHFIQQNFMSLFCRCRCNFIHNIKRRHARPNESCTCFYLARISSDDNHDSFCIIENSVQFVWHASA